jgi:hypothetical protein
MGTPTLADRSGTQPRRKRVLVDDASIARCVDAAGGGEPGL